MSAEKGIICISNPFLLLLRSVRCTNRGRERNKNGTTFLRMMDLRGAGAEELVTWEFRARQNADDDNILYVKHHRTSGPYSYSSASPRGQKNTGLFELASCGIYGRIVGCKVLERIEHIFGGLLSGILI